MTVVQVIPKGATHVSTTYGIITYYKIALGLLVNGKVLYHGVLSGDPFYGWWSWTGDRWQPEIGVRDTHFKTL